MDILNVSAYKCVINIQNDGDDDDDKVFEKKKNIYIYLKIELRIHGNGCYITLFIIVYTSLNIYCIYLAYIIYMYCLLLLLYSLVIQNREYTKLTLLYKTNYAL